MVFKDSIYKGLVRENLNNLSVKLKFIMKKGQISMEYLMIAGFSLAIITVLMIVFSFQNSSQEFQVVDSQINKIGNRIISAAERVAWVGPPARETVKIYMPEKVTNISFYSTELVFKAKLTNSESDLVFPSEVFITGNISTSQGIKYISIIAQDNQVCIVEEGMEECVN